MELSQGVNVLIKGLLVNVATKAVWVDGKPDPKKTKPYCQVLHRLGNGRMQLESINLLDEKDVLSQINKALSGVVTLICELQLVDGNLYYKLAECEGNIHLSSVTCQQFLRDPLKESNSVDLTPPSDYARSGSTESPTQDLDDALAGLEV